jgi:hypothetical protein
MTNMEDTDSRKGTESAPEAAGEEIPADLPLPSPSFEFLVLSLRSQAEMQLGLLHFGEEKDRPKPKLRLARHTIDLMAMLAEKTKGNLTLEEQRLLENSLTELRFRYVQAVEAAKQQ